MKVKELEALVLNMAELINILNARVTALEEKEVVVPYIPTEDEIHRLMESRGDDFDTCKNLLISWGPTKG